MKIYKTASGEGPFYVMGMANILRKYTHLPMNVWISPKGNTKQGPRVKASSVPGDGSDILSYFSMTIEDVPRLVAGKPSKIELPRELSKWIALNKDLLLDYWFGSNEDTVEVLSLLKPLPN